MNEASHVAVIGGGMMGIAVAMELNRTAKVNVTVFEKASCLGGLSSPYTWDSVTWDRFYHVILSTDVHLLDFIHSLGLESKLFWRETKSGFYDQGKLVSMSSMREFIAFPFLSLWQKFRLGLGIFLSTRIRNTTKLDRVYVREWLTRLFGRRVYEKIWDPLLRSKLGASREKTSAAFIWATINRLYGARQGNERVERMGHVHGGYDTILKRSQHNLTSAGVRLLADQEVERVEEAGKGTSRNIMVRTNRGEHQFDKVVMTIPAPEILGVIRHGQDRYWSSLSKVEYLGVICVLLILRKSLSPYYVINLLDKSLPFTGIIEATNVVSPDEVTGYHLVYLPKYVVSDDEMWGSKDSEIIELFLSGLGKVFPGRLKETVVHSAVFREKHVQPLQQVDHLAHAVGFATPVKGIYVVNTSMIYNSTLNNNAVVEVAKNAVKQVVNDAW